MDERLSTALKKMVLKECRVPNVTADEISDSDPVVGGSGLGTHKVQLDSLDAVEIATSLERNFGIKAEGMGSVKNIFFFFSNLAEYVSANSSKEGIEKFVEKYC